MILLYICICMIYYIFIYVLDICFCFICIWYIYACIYVCTQYTIHGNINGINYIL